MWIFQYIGLAAGSIGIAGFILGIFFGVQWTDLHYQAKKSAQKVHEPSATLVLLAFSTVMLILLTAIVFGYLDNPVSGQVRFWDLIQVSILWSVIIYGIFGMSAIFLLFMWVKAIQGLVEYFMALIHGARKDRAERQ